uniref:NF-kappa-B essential modulator NEMO N-terminal domain-containing protein n=1 Tax=Timema bartmani TaxID=61472 RepID=A0A7R9F2Y4_9NEOP|nr:unnamed protein product [Timema bartmani]
MVKVNEKPEEKSPNHQDFGPQSSFSNDGSFVVLEESSVEGMTAQLPNSYLPPSLTFDGLPSVGNSTLGPSNTNGQGACYMSTSMTTDLNPEEIQNKLHELLVENVELKDTLNQNNMAMRQQFHTLVKWQEEVLKVHQNHKEKFAETRDLIHKLRNENEELKKCIAEMKSESSTFSIALEQQLKSENADLKTKILELNQKMSRMVPNGVPTKKEQELIGLLEQVNHQLETAERSRRQLGGDVERLTAQRTRLEHDVDTLKSKLATVQQNKTEPITRVEQLGLSEKQSFVMVESDLQLPSDSLSIIEVQHAQEVAKLKSDLDEQQALVASLIQQLKDRDTKMVSVANSSEAKTPPSYSSEDQTLRQNFKELEKKYYRLQSDYETVQQELASLRDDQQSKDRHNAAYNQVQARGFTEKIDSMTAQVVAKEETLKQKTKEIAQLTEKLKDLAVENEAISILKAQEFFGRLL